MMAVAWPYAYAFMLWLLLHVPKGYHEEVS